MSELDASPALSPALPARSLPELLRGQLEKSGGACTLLIGTVKANPDSQHVTVTVNGADTDVARLASYNSPAVGEPCYLLIAEGIALALGSVR